MSGHNIIVVASTDPRYGLGWSVDCSCGGFRQWVGIDFLERETLKHLATQNPPSFEDRELSDAALLIDILNHDPQDDPTDLLTRAYNRIEAIYG